MGWFPETDDERRRRIDAENRLRVSRERQAKEDAEAKRKKVEKRRKEKEEFQERIDEEVEKHLENLSPQSKQERLEQMQRSTNLLNSALGLEFAHKGQTTPTPWMKAPGIGISPTANRPASSNDEESPQATSALAPPPKVPKLTRPY